MNEKLDKLKIEVDTTEVDIALDRIKDQCVKSLQTLQQIVGLMADEPEQFGLSTSDKELVKHLQGSIAQQLQETQSNE